MSYCPFLVPGHDTADCIVTQQGTDAQGNAVGGCDTVVACATRLAAQPATGHDMASLHAGRAAMLVRTAWP